VVIAEHGGRKRHGLLARQEIDLELHAS
jgi:hypothetical protein